MDMMCKSDIDVKIKWINFCCMIAKSSNFLPILIKFSLFMRNAVFSWAFIVRKEISSFRRFQEIKRYQLYFLVFDKYLIGPSIGTNIDFEALNIKKWFSIDFRIHSLWIPFICALCGDAGTLHCLVDVSCSIIAFYHLHKLNWHNVCQFNWTGGLHTYTHTHTLWCIIDANTNNRYFT